MDNEQSDYELEEALRITRLWQAGKLIGGDAHEVCLALIAHIDALEQRLESIENDQLERRERGSVDG